MLAVDTNVLVRYLTADDARQFAKARGLINNKPVFLCKTVLLETEWVLRSAYQFSPNEIARGLRAVAGLPNVTLEDAAAAARALNMMEAGIDFADALHLASAAEVDAFITFDKDLVSEAGRFGVAIRLP